MISTIKHSLFGLTTVKSFLLDDGELVLVDTGYSGRCAQNILNAVRKIGRRPDEIKLCLLTHRHFDHVKGLRRLRDLCGFKVAAHQAEAEAITEATGVEVDVRAEDGDFLPFAGGLRIIHMPGHTEGNISLLAGRALIVGDSIRGNRGSLRPPSRRFSEDYGLAIQSVLRLTELDFDEVYVSHGRNIERNGKEQITNLIKRLKM
ncbi:MBL fold metallo-hydrolase [Candidatus Bathyarchaeota archaeon]|nr:MBL fold metallo-hydrolase [Candidatus Bathyarchaeota archaeon]